jgi:ABC-2 type transport system permease protein
MFVSMVNAIMSLIALAPVLVVILKLRSEEKDGHTEHVLSRAVSRGKYLCGYVVMALAASVLVQSAIAVGIYASAVAVLPDPGDLTLGYLLGANLVYLPAIWVMIGGAVWLTGMWPKATAVIWGYYGVVFFALFIGRIPNLLPAWLNKLTPYGYIPQLPMDKVNYATLAILTAVAAVLVVGGTVFYRKRDTIAA